MTDETPIIKESAEELAAVAPKKEAVSSGGGGVRKRLVFGRERGEMRDRGGRTFEA